MNKNSFPFALLLIAAAVLACKKTQTNQQPGSTSQPASNAAQPAKSDFRVTQHPNGETGVYQLHFGLSRPVTAGDVPVPGKHKIELSNMASFKGKTPKCVPSSLAFTILHSKPVKDGWQYPRSAKVTFVADGKTSSPTKANQTDLDAEDGGVLGIADRVADVRDRVELGCGRHGRDPDRGRLHQTDADGDRGVQAVCSSGWALGVAKSNED
jgi:hypothetical protein